MLREVGDTGIDGTCRAWGVEVRRSNPKRTTKKDRSPTVVHENDAPETNTELAFFCREYVLVRAGVQLGRGVVVQAKLNGEPDKTSYETPEGAALTLWKV